MAPKLKDLVGENDLPPARQVQLFVTKYVHGGRDLARAACLANLDPKMGKKLYLVPKVRHSIDKQIALIEAEQAHHTAKAALLGVELIDSAVVDSLTKKGERLQPEIVRIAYGRVGLIRDGEFYVAPDPNQPKNQPGIYQRQTTAKRTVTEEVTRTETVLDPIFAVKEY